MISFFATTVESQENGMGATLYLLTTTFVIFHRNDARRGKSGRNVNKNILMKKKQRFTSSGKEGSLSVCRDGDDNK